MLNDNPTLIFAVEGISKHFAQRPSLVQRFKRIKPQFSAVVNASFEVHHGEVLAIIGESGSGKSTLGYMMADMESISEGRILYHGTDLCGTSKQARRRFRKKVQMVFQDSVSSLNPRRRVKYAILDALRLSGMPKEQRYERMVELATLVGLSVGQLEGYPHELSGGQRQRVSIARALAMDPEVLIADEPVSALDVSLQGQIINLLMDLRRNLDLTIVLISHDLAVVSSVSDRVVVMHGGRIVELGSTKEVIRSAGHPYTLELLAAVPTGVPGAAARKQYSEESIAPTKQDSAGCHYYGRCKRARAKCAIETPPLAALTEGRRVLCHYSDEPPIGRK